MTIDISNNDPRISYTVGTGVTQTSFAVPFEFFDDSDVNVYVNEVLQTITTDYSISGGDGSTGTVTMSVTGPATVTLTRDVTIERITDFPTGIDINRAALNTQLDTLTAISADIKDKTTLALRYSDQTVGVNTTLPHIDDLKGRYLAFNEVDGTPQAGATTQEINTLASLNTDIALLADIQDGTIATGAITTVSGVAAEVAALGPIASDITAVNANQTNINTVAGDLTSDDSIGTVAASISNVDTVGANIASVNTVSGINANVTTVAGISGNVTTVAGISSNVSTVAGISSSVSAVAADASDIGIVSANIANIGIVANEISSIVSIEDSVASASASASSAASSASAAATDADDAQAARIAAEAAYDSFDDRFLGAKANDPTVDNDGNALNAGTLYYNTTSNVMKSYNGTLWQVAYTTIDAAGGLLDINNLSDVASAADSRTNLGLGSAAVADSTDFEARLIAMAETKAVTAVDVFVYDTSKDSDGGAWRKRTQHTSWYNETLNTATRGGRREFPAVAVIVAESNKVTIYDGDDPALPMWMVFNSGSTTALAAGVITSVSAINSKAVVGSNTSGAMVFLSFLEDTTAIHVANTTLYYPRIISKRNDGVSTVVSGAGLNIVNRDVNDVAMTVLPDAPIDPATGLPVPTIAVATAGGVSVITDSGAVYDSVRTVNYTSCAFGDDGLYYIAVAYNDLSYATFDDILAGDGFGDIIGGPAAGSQEIDLVSFGAPILRANNDLLIGGTVQAGQAKNGVMRHALNLPDLTKGMSALLTSTYNTGWMPGDIKGAFLADTDDTDLVGATAIQDDFSYADAAAFIAGGWSVNNGSIGDANNWTVDGAGNATITAASANIQLSKSGLTVGKTYTITLDVSARSAGYFNLYAGGSNINPSGITAAGTYTYTFVAAATVIQILAGTGTTGSISSIDIKLADADRSVNNNGLIVNGTVTRSPVATGAELVAYSGFYATGSESTSNFLKQPYNPDLNFGTGDALIMGWFIKGGNNSRVLLDRRKEDGADNNGRFVVSSGTSNTMSFTLYSDTGVGVCSVSGSTAFPIDKWVFFACVRRNGVGELYINSELDGTDSIATGNLSALTEDVSLYVGVRSDLASRWDGSLALLRISGTAPTAEQIKKIYEDEKVLFQENAAATLYGTSDAVTALAHDSDTGLLHVGTSAGRSVFQGLRRVSNTTTAVGTAISAANGLIAEE